MSERIDHLRTLCSGGLAGYAVVATAKDIKARPRKIASYDAENVRAIVSLAAEPDGSVWAELGEEVPVKRLKKHAAKHRLIAADGPFPERPRVKVFKDSAARAFGARLQALKATQGRDRRTLDHRVRLEEQDLARRERSLTRVERREKVALLRDLRAESCIHIRGEDGTMPSLVNIARIEKAARHGRAPALVPVLRPGDTRETFQQAVTRSPTQAPDLLSAFARATQQRQRDRETGDDKAPALDRMTRPSRDGDQVVERGREPDRGGN